MTEEKLINLTRAEISAYEPGTVQVTEKVSYDMRDVLQRARQYLHNQFEEKLESDGSEKVFIPLTSWLKEVLVRNSDIDTKDIQFRSRKGRFGVAAVVRYIVESFNRKAGMGQYLNDLIDEFVGEGQAVTKVIKTEPYLVDNLNIVMNPMAGSIQEAGIIEKKLNHFDKWRQFRGSWKNFIKLENLAVKLVKEGKQPEIMVYERYGWIPGEYVGKQGLVKGCIITSEAELDKTQYRNSNNPSTFHDFVPFRDDEPFPYEECGLERMGGRWWRRGVAEKIFGLQMWINEEGNLQIKSDRQTLRGLFLYESANPVIRAGVLNKLETGGILPIGPNERFTEVNQRPKGEFFRAEDKITEWGRRASGGSEVSSGSQLPANTPATSAAIQQTAANSTFELIRENTGLFLKRLYEKHLLKAIIGALKEGQLIDIIKDKKELSSFDKKYLDHKTSLIAQDFRNEKGMLPNQGEMDYMRGQMQKQMQAMGDQRFLTVQKEIVKELDDLFVEMYVTNESFDKKSAFDGLTSMLTNYSKIVPGRIDIDKVVMESLDLLGLDSDNYLKSDEQMAQEQQARMAAQTMQPAMQAPGANPVNANNVPVG